jgi:hypothetical protein
VDQTHEHFELSGAGEGRGRELLEWDFEAYTSRAGESWVDPLEFLIDDPTFGFGKPLLPLSWSMIGGTAAIGRFFRPKRSSR